MRYRLRTLLIVLTLGPPVLAWLAWPGVQRLLWPPRQMRQINVNTLALASFGFEVWLFFEAAVDQPWILRVRLKLRRQEPNACQQQKDNANHQDFHRPNHAGISVAKPHVVI